MARMIVVAMRPLGFLGVVDGVGVDGGVIGSVVGVAGGTVSTVVWFGVSAVDATGSTVVWFGVSDLFSFVVDAPSGARGFAVPV